MQQAFRMNLKISIPFKIHTQKADVLRIVRRDTRRFLRTLTAQAGLCRCAHSRDFNV